MRFNEMKRFISLLLCMILAVGMTCSFAFADEAAQMNPEEAANAAEENADDEGILNPEEQAAAAAEQSDTPATPYDQMLSGDNLTKVEAPLSENGEIEIGDYSVIEIPENELVVYDSDVESYIESMLTYATEVETITEGVAEDGDSVNIDFSGVLEGEDEPFEGGTAEGYDIVLGSGTFIPGFEEQIVGHEIGETFDIQVTFPEDYSEEMAGKNATFTITLNCKYNEIVPELNDEFVQSFSAAELDEQLNTVDELREYTYNLFYNDCLDNAIMSRITEMTTITSYKESQFNLLKEYFLSDLISSVAYYELYGLEGYDADMIAMLSGYADADSYVTDETIYYMDVIMLLDKIAEDYGIEVTEEEVNEVITSYMSYYGYDTMYSVEDFRELNGEAWVMLMEKLNVLYGKVFEKLRENAVVVEAEETPAEEVEEDYIVEPGVEEFDVEETDIAD